MENLVEKLQNEIGLSEDEAVQAVSVVKEYMDEEGLKIDWDKFFKGKYEEFIDKANRKFRKAARKMDDLSDDLSDKMEDFATQTKRKARDLSKKVYDVLDEEVSE